MSYSGLGLPGFGLFYVRVMGTCWWNLVGCLCVAAFLLGFRAVLCYPLSFVSLLITFLLDFCSRSSFSCGCREDFILGRRRFLGWGCLIVFCIFWAFVDGASLKLCANEALQYFSLFLFVLVLLNIEFSPSNCHRILSSRHLCISMNLHR